jgi:hypothetical protein
MTRRWLRAVPVFWISAAAVGKYNNPGVEQTLVESWNGTRGTVTHSPSPGIDDILNGVSCASGSACTAVGSRERETLIETGR